MSGSSSIIAGFSKPPAITELDASEGLPPSILLEARVYFADLKNSTTATLDTGKGLGIQVSICFADPPALSYVCIHCPGYTEADFSDEPRVVRSEKQFLLLHLLLWGAGFEEQVEEYYMYQAIRGKPKLFRIPDLGPSLSNFATSNDFGIYCCEDSQCILAGLTYTAVGYRFYSYSSASKVWTVKPAHLELEGFLTKERMPVAAHKVILLGGSLLGWVDLWKGILVCDVLCQDPQLVVGFIPLPLTGNTYDHICPWVIRDVTCTNGSLKFIEVEHLSVPPAADENDGAPLPDVMYDEPYFVTPLDDLETEQPCKFVNWRATIWNRVLSDNCWRKGFEVQGNDILAGELGDCTVGVSTVRNLLPSFPTLSICGDDVVHMSSSGRLDIDKTQMISIDMSNNTLKALASCPPVEADDNYPYFPCVLSNYLSNHPALPQVTQASNPENVNGGLPQIVQPSNSAKVTKNESLRSCAQEVISEPNRAQDGGSNFDFSLVVQARNSKNVHADLPQIVQASNPKNVTGNKRPRSCAQEIISVPNGAQNGGSNFDLSLVAQASNPEIVDVDLPQIVQASNSENVTGNKRPRSCAQQVIGAPNRRAQNVGSNFRLSLAPRQSLGLLDIITSHNRSHYEDADYPRPSYGNYQQSLPLLQQPTHLPNWLQLPNWFSPAPGNPHPAYPVVNTASFRPMGYPFPQNDSRLLQTPYQVNPHPAYPVVKTASFRPGHPFPQFPLNDLRLLQTPSQALVPAMHFSTPSIPPAVGCHFAPGSRHRWSHRRSPSVFPHRMTSPAYESLY